MKPLRGCSGITKHACTQPWAISAQSSSNNSGIEAQKRSQVNRFQNQKQAMEKQESKTRFPTFPQPRRLRTITTYGIRILRARSYLDRDALKMVSYLDKLQQPNGLFFHAPDVPFFWGR